MITLPVNVYQALQRRLEFVFAEFDNVYVSFSGGKDSGLLLNLVIRFMRERGITRKIGVFHQDFEAQYTATTEYVERTMTANPDLIEPIWFCLPMTVRSACSMFEKHWTPWEPAKRDIWVRDLPQHRGVYTIDNHPFDFYRFCMPQEDVYREFGPWFRRRRGGGRTVGLVGIRTAESLNRWRAIMADKDRYRGRSWTTAIDDDVWSAYPLYDWKTEDVWTATARFGFDYNRLYDLFHLAGVPLAKMRVASPFNDYATDSLKLYRVIEPDVWAKMLGRVQGANFAALYGGTRVMGWKSIRLPPGHSWKSYVEFLLATLPAETAATYREKFGTSIAFWRDRGGVLSAQTIAELEAAGIKFTVKGATNYKTDKVAVVFDEYPDDLEVTEFQTAPSWKRMAVCILKNDHLCKFMGFSQTKEEAERRRKAIQKYMAL
ncbi:MAG TPA: DUF3440 domain-containing protein [Azospirillaceae bacterium]|nr:DUF3440 domain-containing protein [Azospirillaceae bacterium]